MGPFEENAKKYWDQRYQAEGQIWGQTVSRTAWIAIQLFGSAGVNRVLVPGSGYGRHTVLLATSGFDVTGSKSRTQRLSWPANMTLAPGFLKARLWICLLMPIDMMRSFVLMFCTCFWRRPG